MRKTVACLALLSLVPTLGSSFQAQTRPRRVQDSSSSPSSPPAATNRAPVQPPVLRGAINSKEQQPAKSEIPIGPEEVEPGDVVRVNTTLVTFPVSVMDRDGRFIPNLRKEDFRLLEEGVQQEVAFFSSIDR